MRVVFVSQPRDPIVASGVQGGSVAIVTWELARRIAGTHEVTIYAPHESGQPAEERAPDGPLIRRMPNSFRLLHKTLDIGSGLFDLSPPYFSTQGFHREYASDVVHALARDVPDVVHVQTYAQFIPLIRRAVPNARIVFQVHDELLTCVRTPAVESRVSMADEIVTCSDYVTQRWRERFPRQANRIHTIGNGVDLERFRPVEREVPPRILYVGRVSPEKGVHVLVQAFERVLTAVPDALLQIVGPAGLLPWSQLSLLADDPHIAALAPFYGRSLSERIQKQIVRAGDGYLTGIKAKVSAATVARIEMRGTVAYDDVPQLYRETAVLAVPSLVNEPFGLPVAEAMASGVPVVASRCGGIPECVQDGATGLLVERGDVDALSQALQRILVDRATRIGMGHAARLQAEAVCGWSRAAARLASIYQSQQHLPQRIAR
jgi:glycosyltransferase involved in cell wall biosynthesis